MEGSEFIHFRCANLLFSSGKERSVSVRSPANKFFATRSRKFTPVLEREFEKYLFTCMFTGNVVHLAQVVFPYFPVKKIPGNGKGKKKPGIPGIPGKIPGNPGISRLNREIFAISREFPGTNTSLKYTIQFQENFNTQYIERFKAFI